MRVVPKGSTRRVADREEPPDSEVPAAVVCAHCGDADCAGCLEEQTKSGVVAVIAWERPGAPALTRLWATARATTFDADRFFESLPDGPIGPALRFAVLCETIAATAVMLTALVPLALVAPRWLVHVLFDQGSPVARLAIASVPAIAGFLVAAHAAHGWALDRGARRVGARAATTRAVRFGLYAAGWDLVIGPLGAVVTAFKEGGRAALSLGSLGFGIPARSARAFLRGAYGLEGDRGASAGRTSYLVIAAAIVLGALLAICGVVYLLLA